MKLITTNDEFFSNFESVKISFRKKIINLKKKFSLIKNSIEKIEIQLKIPKIPSQVLVVQSMREEICSEFPEIDLRALFYVVSPHSIRIFGYE